MPKIRLPAEWEPHDGVLMAWPHAGTDWADSLDAVTPCFAAIGREISRRERLLVISPEPEPARRALAHAGAAMERVQVVELPTDDTWTRDYGPIAVRTGRRLRLLDFGFNGWGLKFGAANDNQATRRLAAAGVFAAPVVTPGLWLEGGSIESDGAGTILTTSACLLSPNRNPHLDRVGVEAALRRHLGAARVLWLDHGHLAGDDTDAHIDTLARLAPEGAIVFQACDDRADEHHADLAAMAGELAALRQADGRPYRLFPLPWPRPARAADGHRLPATYANFLIIDGAVLVPTYGDPADAGALAVVAQAFPDREVVGLDCRPIIEQHGSLHCLTMQLPQGALT